MIELNASFRSVETNVTKLQAYSEKKSLAVLSKENKSDSPLLNAQQQQIIDDVDISAGALKQLEEAQALATQLQQYLDYLKGRNDNNRISLVPKDKPNVVIAGESTKIAASITVATYQEETLDINAKFDDDGTLRELTIDKKSISAEYIDAQFVREDFSFIAAA